MNPVGKITRLNMGSAESKDKMYCTRYLNGDGPPAVTEQGEQDTSGTINRKGSSVIVQGNQPDGGQIKLEMPRRSVEGYPKHDTIRISFVFEDGIQTENHPNPGQKYYGLQTTAYLPQNTEGSKVYSMLCLAFQYKLLFTVATTSTGEERVTFTDIPLKSQESGGGRYGYPDPDYLKTVMKILKSKGIK